MSTPQQRPRSLLEEAAMLLHRSLQSYESFYGGLPSGAASLADKRLQIAGEFAKLAAIERGLVPAEWLKDVVREAMKEERR
jgi:hypothetical protein